MAHDMYTDDDGGFDDLGSFLAAVALSDDQFRDPRLIFTPGGFDATAAGANSVVPSAGGFAVPDAFASALLERLYDTGAILGRCFRLPVGRAGSLKIPAVDERSRIAGSRFGGLQTYWAEEAETVTATKPKWRSLTLEPRKLVGLGYATNDLVRDVPALGAMMGRLFTLEGVASLENEVINGAGTLRPLGILNSGALITVAAESGQAPGTITGGNVVDMYARMWAPSRRRAVWLVNAEAEPQIYSIGDYAGTSLFRWADDGTPRLMGRPVLPVEYCPAVGAAGDIVLADLGEYIVAERSIDFTPSMHVRFLSDEMAFRFTYRVDGQPAWHTPVTPQNGTATVSPFVILEAR